MIRMGLIRRNHGPRQWQWYLVESLLGFKTTGRCIGVRDIDIEDKTGSYQKSPSRRGRVSSTTRKAGQLEWFPADGVGAPNCVVCVGVVGGGGGGGVGVDGGGAGGCVCVWWSDSLLLVPNKLLRWDRHPITLLVPSTQSILHPHMQWYTSDHSILKTIWKTYPGWQHSPSEKIYASDGTWKRKNSLRERTNRSGRRNSMIQVYNSPQTSNPGLERRRPRRLELLHFFVHACK